MDKETALSQAKAVWRDATPENRGKIRARLARWGVTEREMELAGLTGTSELATGISGSTAHVPAETRRGLPRPGQAPAREDLRSLRLVALTHFRSLLFALVVLVVVLCFAWIFRYDITRADKMAYVLDRWTGEVYFVRGSQKIRTVDR